MSSVAFVYLIVKTVEFFIFFLVGKKNENARSRIGYWKISSLAIIAFAFIEGLRWGHAIDYNVYAVRYMGIDAWLTFSERSSPFFTIIVYLLKLLGTPFQIFLILECGLLAFSMFFLFEQMKNYGRWLVPCFLIVLLPNENFIRFYFALSFFLFGLKFLLDGNRKFFFILSGIASLIHFAMVPIFLIFVFARILEKINLNKNVVIVLLIVSTFFVSIQHLGFLARISTAVANLFGNVDNVGFAYLGGMDRIIAGEAGKMGLLSQKFSSQVKVLLYTIPIFYYTKNFLREYKWGNFSYNIAAIGAIITPVFNQVELLGRITNVLNIYLAVLMGCLACVFFRKNEKPWHIILAVVALICFFYPFINAPFTRPDYMMYFIWDSNGNDVNWAPYYR